MSFIKKQSTGFYITVLTVILAGVSLISYLINCNTEYFTASGVNAGIVILLAAGIILEAVYIAVSNKMGQKEYFDIIPVLCGVVIILAFVLYLSERVSSIATIMSFEKNAQTISDLSSAIVAMAACLLAAIFNITGSFFRIVKK